MSQDVDARSEFGQFIIALMRSQGVSTVSLPKAKLTESDSWVLERNQDATTDEVIYRIRRKKDGGYP